MKILHKKIKVIVVCLFTCALFVVGLFSIPTPLIAYAAETIDFEFYSLSVASQLSFSVRVPSSALNLLKQGRTANGYSYTDYFLQIKYSKRKTAMPRLFGIISSNRLYFVKRRTQARQSTGTIWKRRIRMTILLRRRFYRRGTGLFR